MKRRSFCAVAFYAALFPLSVLTARSQPPAPPTAKRLPTIWLIGDSTVNTRTDVLRGWGLYLSNFVDPARAIVQNKARGGRSSRTFLEEGLWKSVTEQIQPGDFVLMQFGHNDGGPLGRAPYRATLHGAGDETGTFDDPQTKMPHLVHTYGWYMEQYVKEAKAKGATPVVLSPVPRNMWSLDNKTANRSDKDYGGWAKEIAEKNKVPFVNLNGIIAAHYEADGQPKVASEYFTVKDHTHTTIAGAQLNAQSVAEGIKTGAKTQPALAPLAALLLDKPAPFAPEAQPAVKPQSPPAPNNGDSEKNTSYLPPNLLF